MAGRPERARGCPESGCAPAASVIGRGRSNRDPGRTSLAPGERSELKNCAGCLRSKIVSATLRGMEEGFRYRGRVITAAEVEFIRRRIAEHPRANRWRLSKVLGATLRTVPPHGSAYSILLSCRQQRPNPQEYLAYTLARLPSSRVSQICELLLAH